MPITRQSQPPNAVTNVSSSVPLGSRRGQIRPPPASICCSRKSATAASSKRTWIGLQTCTTSCTSSTSSRSSTAEILKPPTSVVASVLKLLVWRVFSHAVRQNDALKGAIEVCGAGLIGEQRWHCQLPAIVQQLGKSRPKQPTYRHNKGEHRKRRNQESRQPQEFREIPAGIRSEDVTDPRTPECTKGTERGTSSWAECRRLPSRRRS